MKILNTIHFIGIGGAGMSGIADVLLELGYKVSGSDLKTSKTTEYLKKKGAKVFLGHFSDNIVEGIDKVVISSAIPEDNPEIVRAKELNIPVIKRAEMLAELMKNQKAICVAGAHGKTTTSSMIASVLEISKFDPSIVVGGEITAIGSNAKLGKGEYLVAEADESDGSFLKLYPWSNVITNIEDDHLDFYGSMDNIIKAFSEFVSLGSPNGYTILCFDDPIVRKLIPYVPGKLVTYGFSEEANIHARNISYQGLKTVCDIYFDEEYLGELELNSPGKHNLSNALATIAICRELGLTFTQIKYALGEFLGVKRRFQFIGRIDDISVYDDYGHHPTEIKACLQAAKNGKKDRVIVIFQPHRYTRTKLLASEFADSFFDADEVILTDIYSAGEKTIPGVSSELILEKMPKSVDAKYIKEFPDVLDYLRSNVKPGDLVITLGAGNVWNIGVDLVNTLKNEKLGVS